MSDFDEKFEVVELCSLNTEVTCNDGSLFNRSMFFHLHCVVQSRHDMYLILLERRKGTVQAMFWCSDIGNGHYRSPKRGSFGGIEVLSPLSFEAREGFVDAIVDIVKGRGGRCLEIILPPLSYTPASTSLTVNVLLRSGFVLSGHELNYSMSIDPDVGFRSLVDAKNRNKMNKCMKSSFLCRTLSSLEELEEAYRVIEINRAKKNIPMTMPWAALLEMHESIPDSVCCFGCYSDGKMVASSICVRISAEILYVFYWGEIDGVESFSPLSYLAEHIYNFCVENSYRNLDAGTASIEGIPNVGLASYKKKLGFGESLKLTLLKTIC